MAQVKVAKVERNSPEAAREALLVMHANRASGIVRRAELSTAAREFAVGAGWLAPAQIVAGYRKPTYLTITASGAANAAEFAPQIAAQGGAK